MIKLYLCISLILTLWFTIVKAQWIECDSGINTSQAINHIAADGNNIYAVCSDGGLFYLSTDNGNTWNIKNNGLTNPGYGMVVNGNNICIASKISGVFLSSNNGDNWITKDSGLPDNDIFALAKNGNNIFAGSPGAGIYLSTDNGNNWIDKNNGLTDKNVSCLVINGNKIIAATERAICFSTDNGDNWTSKSISVLCDGIFSIAIKGNYIFVATDYGLSISTDNGVNWTTKNNGFNEELPMISVIAISGDNIFAGDATYGVYLSTDNGNSWIQRNSGMNNINISSMAISDNYIFAGTRNGNIYKANLNDFGTSDVTENNINNAFNLSPNPASDNISISFTNSDLLNPTISIYNSIGIEIKRFNDNELLGKRTINLTINDFPSGIYYCTLNSGTNKITKSFVVIK